MSPARTMASASLADDRRGKKNNKINVNTLDLCTCINEIAKEQKLNYMKISDTAAGYLTLMTR